MYANPFGKNMTTLTMLIVHGFKSDAAFSSTNEWSVAIHSQSPIPRYANASKHQTSLVHRQLIWLTKESASCESVQPTNQHCQRKIIARVRDIQKPLRPFGHQINALPVNLQRAGECVIFGSRLIIRCSNCRLAAKLTLLNIAWCGWQNVLLVAGKPTFSHQNEIPECL